jgi:thymidine kinase
MVVSHNANEIRSTPVPAAANIAILAQGCDVVGIDEAQFFDDEIVRVCNDLANQGIRVIVAGLIWTLKEILWTHAGSYGYCRIRN